MAFNHLNIIDVSTKGPVHAENKNHWIALSTVSCQTACAKIFDSSGSKKLPKSTLKSISDLLQAQEKLFSVQLLMFRCRKDHLAVEIWPACQNVVVECQFNIAAVTWVSFFIQPIHIFLLLNYAQGFCLKFIPISEEMS